MMSQQFLQEEISKASQTKIDLQNAIHSLLKERAAFQQIVDAYEKKRGLGKLFANKDAVFHAQNRIVQIDKQLNTAREDDKRQEKLKQTYEEQLETLLMLKEQISHIVPTHTQEYWENEKLKRQNRLMDVETALPQLQKKADEIADELNHLIAEAAATKNAYTIIQELAAEFGRQEEAVKQLEITIADKKQENEKLIEAEKKLCAVFYYTDQSEPSMLLSELADLMQRVQTELIAYNISDLEKEKETKEKELSEVLDQLDEVLRKLSELEKQVILDAKIIGATLAKSYISEPLRARTFDTVILDEASMASIPALWCTSYLAEKNIVIVGDFLQLPPIVVADEKREMAQKWLGKDIFYHSGMQQRVKADPQNPPECFVMLNDQFRMEKEIADVANMYYGEYGGLITPKDTERRNEAREKFYNWYAGKRTKHCIHLIDTSTSNAWVTGIQQGKSHSRLNCLSAIIDVDLAFMCLENKLADHKDEEEQEASILIVAPYKPQIKQINQLISIEYLRRGFTKDLGLIKAGTIHSFQGNEADIVIFDLVIDMPHYKANLFMTGDDINRDLEKMFNVALTRTKFKLFLIGNFPYCIKKAKGNALSSLLDKLINQMGLNTVSVYQLFSDHLYTKSASQIGEKAWSLPHMVCSSDTFAERFQDDLHLYQRQCIVYSPILDEAYVDALLPDFILCKDNGKQIILVTELTRKNEREEKKLIDAGVKIIHKKGIHEKLAFFDDDVVWTCSDSPLGIYMGKHNASISMMHRHCDDSVAAEYRKIFCIKSIIDAVERRYELLCPICAQEMLVRESDNGGIYWECVQKDYFRNTDQPYPVGGLYHCKCGAPYLFSMKKQPRWVCSVNPNHYQLVRLSDLKLEKMAELIPQGLQEKVKRYFDNI